MNRFPAFGRVCCTLGVCLSAHVLLALNLEEKHMLWPEGKMPYPQAHQIAATTEEVKTPGFNPDENRNPHIRWFTPEKGVAQTDVCMIIVSGGGYYSCCDGPSFRPFVKQMLAAGIHCVNLTYRTPRPKGAPIYRSAWADGQRAVRLVRAQAAARGFDPEKIGTFSCSAGSHLSLMLATGALTPAYAPVDELDKTPCHLNWAIPLCPAYVLSDGLEGPNAQGGENATLSSAFPFDAKTCPMCFFHGQNDPYSPLGSTQLYRQLRRMKIPAELHLDANRKHGVPRSADFERALEFLRQLGILGKPAREIALDHRFMPGATLRTEKEMLWPQGKMPDASLNQTYEPYLVWFVPEKCKTKAIQVVFPGGGYYFCNFNGEGTPVAHYLNEKGMTTVVVMYRCPRAPGKPKHFTAFQDAQRAIRLVRAAAPKRGLDPARIGVMGFSAGGHLALMAATSSSTRAYEPVDDVDREACSVQWACPIYPAYVLTDGADRPNKTGGNADDAVLVDDFAFDAATPPMCFVHGDADSWASMNAVKVWEKLRRMAIPGDLHTLALRGHCFQIRASPGTGSYTWMDQVWTFMSRLKLNR